jgi:elongation factor P hydroxylase
LEYLFAQAANVEFRASADNLNADITGFEVRLNRSKGSVKDWLLHTQDNRARCFLDALAKAAEVSGGEANGAR